MRVLGIDEAGRGCVLGALYVGAFVADGVDDATLRAAGADDSKKLSPKRRIAAREKLAALGTAHVTAVEATTIDGENLNRLEEDAIVDLVDRFEPDVVLVDALGHPRTLPTIVARLQSRTRVRARWTMEPKADGTYPAVGAASIFAKTTRDAALDALAGEFGVLGSGYPSDPETKAWLAGWAASKRPWPAFVRTRWETIRVLGQLGIGF
jgi:ribonuclease HII